MGKIKKISKSGIEIIVKLVSQYEVIYKFTYIYIYIHIIAENI